MKNRDYSVNQHLIDCFIFYVLTDDSFIQKVRPVVEPKYFLKNEIVKNVLQLCYNFYDVAGVAPKDHINDELVEFLKGKEPEHANFYWEYLTRISKLEQGRINQNYVLARIDNFVKRYELETAAVKFVNLVKEGKYDLAIENIMKACRSGIPEVELGYDWSDLNAVPPYLLPEHRAEKVVSLGIEYLDSILTRGICKKDFVCIAGPYKGMKSFYLHHLGIIALEEGRKVLHITHENSKEETWARYDSMVAGLNSSDLEEPKEIRFVQRDEQGIEIGSFTSMIDSVYRQTGLVRKMKQNLLRFGGKLRIQEFPMGRCTMGDLNRFLSQLELEGYYPDLVINDYIEKMYIDPNRKRHEVIDDMYKESKAIASERHLAMITASQITSDSLDRITKSQRSLAEARSKTGDVDLMIGLSSTEELREQGISVAYIMGNRHGPQSFGCYFDSILASGDFSIHSWPLQTGRREF